MNAQITVAAPWSLTHYMPLNGFHPLYRALFEAKPEWVTLAAWDTVELSQKLRSEPGFRKQVLHEVGKDSDVFASHAGSIEQGYFNHFSEANLSLTRLLPGDIEFHHTAPFPSFERPFVFHCEAFAPLFFPLAHQGSGGFGTLDVQEVRDHYRAIFEHPLCLGVFSHIPQTLEEIRQFFASPIIERKLYPSRIGLYGSNTLPTQVAKSAVQAPLFLFVNSANQNRGNFVLRGGHLALRYWQRTYPEPGAGRLIMRCARPMDSDLANHGVDLAWLHRHEGRSIIWIENYLSEAELDSLMQAAHFLLLPSMSLHSVSIMSAMAAGAVPIVSDTVGTDRYVEDGVDGVVLRGIYANNWRQDETTGLMFNCFERSATLEEDLVEQLVQRLDLLLANPGEYAALQQAAISKARSVFSAAQFSQDFWAQVQRCYQARPDTSPSVPATRTWPELNRCLIENQDWSRLFTSTPQPMPRLEAGSGRVLELGGCMIFTPPGGPITLHNWSPLAEYLDEDAPSLRFATSIKGLNGCYLATPYANYTHYRAHRFKVYVAQLLQPYPWLFAVAVTVLRWARHLTRRVKRRLPGASVAKQTKQPAVPADIELIAQNIKGLNIIRCGHMFYGISPAAGEFIPALAQDGKYDPCVVGSSLKDIARQLEALPGTGDLLTNEKRVVNYE